MHELFARADGKIKIKGTKMENVVPPLAQRIKQVFSSQPASQVFDLVILNGKILDGIGNPWYQADIGIRNGRIPKALKILATFEKPHQYATGIQGLIVRGEIAAHDGNIRDHKSGRVVCGLGKK